MNSLKEIILVAFPINDFDGEECNVMKTRLSPRAASSQMTNTSMA